MVLMRQSSAIALLATAILAAAASSASAQGLFDFLFGSWSTKKTPPASESSRRSLPNSQRGYRPNTPYATDEREEERYSRGGRSHYRTICVRLCDGYYWPVSQNASRAEFHRDAEQCRSQCVNEARLYYLPSSNADVAAAVDLAGLTYPSLNTAYLYRKQRVAGCICRPVPWSTSERDRHRGYAVDDAVQRHAEQSELRERARLAQLAQSNELEPIPDPKSAADLPPANDEPVNSLEKLTSDAPSGRHHLLPTAMDDDPTREESTRNASRRQVFRGSDFDQSRSVDPG